jgi:RsiW-degrading membrane proteinase PrsW (M82 family)
MPPAFAAAFLALVTLAPALWLALVVHRLRGPRAPLWTLGLLVCFGALATELVVPVAGWLGPPALDEVRDMALAWRFALRGAALPEELVRFALLLVWLTVAGGARRPIDIAAGAAGIWLSFAAVENALYVKVQGYDAGGFDGAVEVAVARFALGPLLHGALGVLASSGLAFAIGGRSRGLLRALGSLVLAIVLHAAHDAVVLRGEALAIARGLGIPREPIAIGGVVLDWLTLVFAAHHLRLCAEAASLGRWLHGPAEGVSSENSGWQPASVAQQAAHIEGLSRHLRSRAGHATTRLLVRVVAVAGGLAGLVGVLAQLLGARGEVVTLGGMGLVAALWGVYGVRRYGPIVAASIRSGGGRLGRAPLSGVAGATRAPPSGRDAGPA